MHTLSQFDEATQSHLRLILSRINQQAPAELRYKLEELLIEFQDVFIREGERPIFITDFVHKIQTKPNIPPYAARPLLKPEAKLKFEREAVEELLDYGHIEKCSSPYASRVLVVPKAGGKMRLVIDYRVINQYIIDSGFPMHGIDVMFHWLVKRHKIISVMDLSAGYHQVRLHPDSRDLLAFITFLGIWRPVCLMFGQADGARGFLTAMHDVFAELLYTVLLNYFDDLVFSDSDHETHLTHLRLGFERMRKRQVKIQPK